MKEKGAKNRQESFEKHQQGKGQTEMKMYGKCNCGRKKQRPVSREQAQNGTAPAWKLHEME